MITDVEFEQCLREMSKNPIGIQVLTTGQLPPSYNDGSGYCPEGYTLIAPTLEELVQTVSNKLGTQIADSGTVLYQLDLDTEFASVRIYVMPRVLPVPDVPYGVPSSSDQKLISDLDYELRIYKKFELYKEMAATANKRWTKLGKKDKRWLAVRFPTAANFLDVYTDIAQQVENGAELVVRNSGAGDLTLRYVISDFSADPSPTNSIDIGVPPNN